MEISGTTKVAGVFGYPVKHSLSPGMHNAAFRELGLDWIYVPFSVSPSNVCDALNGVKSLDIIGVNVTVPLKEDVIPHLDELSDIAKHVKAVNTISNICGKLIGENTDVIGFVRSLGDNAEGNFRRALIYGAGGSARAIAYALRAQNWRVTVVNRTEERAKVLASDLNQDGKGDNLIETGQDSEDALVELLSNTSLLVNCTPVGMHPAIDDQPCIPIQTMPHSSIIYDLIYRPLETRLLKKARELGFIAINGVEMLVQQGAASFEIWTGQQAPVDVMREALMNQLKNVEPSES